RSLLDQVEERHAEPAVALGDGHDEPKVRLDHVALRGRVAALDALREHDLLGRGQQLVAADVRQGPRRAASGAGDGHGGRIARAQSLPPVALAGAAAVSPSLSFSPPFAALVGRAPAPGAPAAPISSPVRSSSRVSSSRSSSLSSSSFANASSWVGSMNPRSSA